MAQSPDRDFSRFEVMVFDWDGTVADSVALVVQSIQRTAESLGYGTPDADAVRSLVGLGLNEILGRLMPQVPPSRYPDFVNTYRRHYFGNRQQMDVPFEGITAMLTALAAQGKRLAVATGKSRPGLNRVLESTGLAPVFEATRCAEEGVSKPDPWMLRSLAEEMGVTAAQMVMIGDTIYDIDMAEAFGCASIGVYYDTGVLASLERCHPDATAGSVAELSRLLMPGS